MSARAFRVQELREPTGTQARNYIRKITNRSQLMVILSRIPFIALFSNESISKINSNNPLSASSGVVGWVQKSATENHISPGGTVNAFRKAIL